jgi:hypothetical protein
LSASIAVAFCASVITPSEIAAAVAPFGAAALLLAAKMVGEPLGVAQPTVVAILEATGASRSRAYELARALMSALPGLVRPVGRPRAEHPPAPERDGETIGAAVLRYVMEHPGAASTRGARHRYSDGFRLFVLELRGAHADVEIADFAHSTNVPLGTLKSWLAASELPKSASSPAEPHRDPRVTTATGAQIESVLAAYESFVDFCTHVRDELRIPWGRSIISDILESHDARRARSRGGRSPDEVALRGAFACFFPGAQWVGDGKTVAVAVGEQSFSFNLELDVDAFSGAFVGMSVRRTEDSEAVMQAFADGVATTGASPLALLLDNKASNHTSEVDAVLGETLRIRATPERPQNKAHAEGAFGLFSQSAPPLAISWPQSPAELAETILRLVATTWARATNHRPRADRGGRSRVELYGESPTDEQVQAARRALEDRLAKQERARATAEARQRPEVRSLLDQSFQRLGLLDPERNTRLAIARYPTDAIVDGIAIFEAKKGARTLPEGADARYLLGIVRNVAEERELMLLSELLLRRRVDARDATLATLVAERESLATRGNDHLVAEYVDRALLAPRIIDRAFWLDALCDHISSAPPADLRRRYHQAARRISATFRAPPRARQHALCALAARVEPLD